MKKHAESLNTDVQQTIDNYKLGYSDQPYIVYMSWQRGLLSWAAPD